jgi:N-acetylglucosaminyl-diphospho-decaprenol L-rhamnosyltransferase
MTETQAESQPFIYFITVNYYSSQLISNLLESLEKQATIPYQLIIVNNSPDESDIEELNQDKTVILQAGENLGFGKGCNLGMQWVYEQNSEGIIWLINPDTLMLTNSLEKVPDFFSNHPEVSILGTMVYEPSGEIWFGGGEFNRKTGSIIIAYHLFLHNPNADYLTCDWVTGCSCLINLKKFKNCPEFDAEYFLYYEDFDFCQRYAQQGHVIAMTNHLAVFHQPSEITNKNLFHKYYHSTYSYLFTIQKYCHPVIYWFRLARLAVNGLWLLVPDRPVGWGKIKGILSYLKRER